MSSTAILFERDNQTPTFAEETSAAEIRPPSPAAADWQVKVFVGGCEVVERIYAEWTALCEEGPCNEPFFRPEWFVAFIKNFEKEIRLLTVWRGAKLRAVLPLTVKNGNLHGAPARKVQAVFNLQTQRFDLIHGATGNDGDDERERREIIAALWSEIKKRSNWDVLELRLVKKDSWLRDLLRLAASENYATGLWPMDGAPFITLPLQSSGDDAEKLIEAHFKTLKRRFRHELKRRLSRLNEAGRVEFVKTRGYSAELMRKFFELEAASWKGRRGTAAACDTRAEKLHDDFARAVAARDALFIYELKLDDRTIAMSINIMFDRRKTVFWKTSFDERYARYSPGNLLIREFLADCIRSGSTELDMLSPATDYKKVWATGEREHFAFYVFRRSLYGRLLWKWKFSVIRRLRRWKTKGQPQNK